MLAVLSGKRPTHFLVDFPRQPSCFFILPAILWGIVRISEQSSVEIEDV